MTYLIGVNFVISCVNCYQSSNVNRKAISLNNLNTILCLNFLILFSFSQADVTQDKGKLLLAFLKEKNVLCVSEQ